MNSVHIIADSIKGSVPPWDAYQGSAVECAEFLVILLGKRENFHIKLTENGIDKKKWNIYTNLVCIMTYDIF